MPSPKRGRIQGLTQLIGFPRKSMEYKTKSTRARSRSGQRETQNEAEQNRTEYVTASSELVEKVGKEKPHSVLVLVDIDPY